MLFLLFCKVQELLHSLSVRCKISHRIWTLPRPSLRSYSSFELQLPVKRPQFVPADWETALICTPLHILHLVACATIKLLHSHTYKNIQKNPGCESRSEAWSGAAKRPVGRVKSRTCTIKQPPPGKVHEGGLSSSRVIKSKRIIKRRVGILTS